MDENRIGPNMNTTPAQRYVKVRPYPSAKAVPLQLDVLDSNPSGAICKTIGNTRDTMGKTFLVSFCFDFLPCVGDPRECRGDVPFPPTYGSPRRQGLVIQF